MTRELDKIHIASQIRFLFLTKWENKWVIESELRQQNRLWNQVFQELVDQNYIEKKKESFVVKYKWKDPINSSLSEQV